MTPPPRMRLLTSRSWDALRVVGEATSMHPGFSAGTISSIIPGLRSGGQALRGITDLRYDPRNDGHGGNWNSLGLLFDTRLTAAIGTDELLVRFLATSAATDLQLRRGTTGLLYLTNQVSAPVINWDSGRVFASNVVRKIEVLVYTHGIRNGVYQAGFKILIEGVTWLEQYYVNIGTNSTSDNMFSTIRWDNANQDLDDLAIFVGVGGFGDGDVRSDTAGNPRILPLYALTQGDYTDGSPTGAGTNLDAVNETPISNTTDHMSLTAGTVLVPLRYSVGLDPLPGTVTRVLGVAGFYYEKTDTGGQVQPMTFLRSKPETLVGIDGRYREPSNSSYSSSTTFNKYFGGWWRKDPATGREFSIAAVNSMQLGWGRETSTGGTNWSVSHIYAEVLCYVSPPAVLAAPTAQRSLLVHKTHRLAHLWDLWPRWGMPMFFTDHIAPLIYQGRTYVPAGGWSTSERRRELGLKESNVDFRGAFTSAAITADDLRAGRYRQARVTEYLVDWMHPFAGPIMTTPWTIEDGEFDNEVWVATVSGLQARLSDKAGDAFYPRCRFHLYDDDLPISGIVPTWERGCKLDSFGYYRKVDIGVVTDRRVFDVSIPGSPSMPAGWFDNGLIVFTTGGNTNIVGEIRTLTGTIGGSMSLHLPMPYDVVNLDSAVIWPGCNYLIGTVNAGDCGDKYGNGRNYGGFILIPGTDEATRATSL